MLTVAKIDRFDLLNNPGGHSPATVIWFSGCSLKCKGCHNTELWDKNNGEKISADELVSQIANLRLICYDVVLLGGEPLEQDADEFGHLVDLLSEFKYNIWLYTSKEIDEIPPQVLNKCYFVKTGEYIEELKTNGFPASSNQLCYRRDNEYNQLVLQEV